MMSFFFICAEIFILLRYWFGLYLLHTERLKPFVTTQCPWKEFLTDLHRLITRLLSAACKGRYAVPAADVCSHTDDSWGNKRLTVFEAENEKLQTQVAALNCT